MTQKEFKKLSNYFLLIFGIISITVGIIFFFAYNWNYFSKWHKFLFANIVLLFTGFFSFKGDIRSSKNKIISFGFSILVGGFIALIGQVYHSGADTYQLFLIWGLLVLPIAIVLNFSPLWLLEVILLNTTLILYYKTFFGIGFVELNFYSGFSVLITVNTLIMAIFSTKTIQETIPKLINLFNNGIITVLVISSIIQEEQYFTFILYIFWLGINFYLYRIKATQKFNLAMCLVSILVVSIGAYIKITSDSFGDMFNFFIMAVIAISISSFGIKWLKSINKGEAYERNQ